MYLPSNGNNAASKAGCQSTPTTGEAEKVSKLPFTQTKHHHIMLRTPTSRVGKATAQAVKAASNPLNTLKKVAAQKNLSTVVEGIQKVRLL